MRKVVFIVLTVVLREEEDCWTAECQELGTTSFGDTFNEARDNIKDAIELHLNELDAVGETERFFKENNITLHRKNVPEVNVKTTTTGNTFINPVVRTLTLNNHALSAC